MFRRNRTLGLAILGLGLAAMGTACLSGCRAIRWKRSMTQRATQHPGLIWRCSAEGLSPVLLENLVRAADEYLQETGKALVVNSGKRSLRKQAELMAAMSRGQLEGMYCRNGYPAYIRAILDHREQHGNATTEDTWRILADRADGFISSHLYGGAVDIASEDADIAILKKVLAKHGFRILDERSLGIACIHATCRDVPKAIVR